MLCKYEQNVPFACMVQHMQLDTPLLCESLATDGAPEKEEGLKENFCEGNGKFYCEKLVLRYHN